MHLNLIKTIAIVALLSSCSKGNNVPSPDPVGNADIENMISTEEFKVPIKDGFTTVITQGMDTLAIASSPITILIPKGSAPSSKENSINQININYTDDVIISKENQTTLWQVIAFEDSKKNDYDYNDLVIHTKAETRNGVLRIGIQPVALGASKKIALGYKIFQKGENITGNKIVCDDCRKALFNNYEGYINTSTINHKFPWFIKSKIQEVKLKYADSPAYIVWFINVLDEEGPIELCAINQHQDHNILDNNFRPYGIVFSKLLKLGEGYNQKGQPDGSVGLDWFRYPKESISIENSYLHFDKWVKGEVDNFAFNYLHSTDKEKYNITDDNTFKIYYKDDADKSVYVMKNYNLF